MRNFRNELKEKRKNIRLCFLSLLSKFRFTLFADRYFVTVYKFKKIVKQQKWRFWSNLIMMIENFYSPTFTMLARITFYGCIEDDRNLIYLYLYLLNAPAGSNFSHPFHSIYYINNLLSFTSRWTSFMHLWDVILYVCGEKGA